MKDSFPYKDLKIFELDYAKVQSTYKTFPRISHQQIDSIIDFWQTYLYSWQNSRRSDILKFTCLTIDEYRGFFLTYFVSDTTDRIISSIRVASLNGEDGVSFRSTSSFLSTDTLYKISAISTDLDRKGSQPYQKLPHSIGDSIFYKIIFDSSGSAKQITIAEKKELNY